MRERASAQSGSEFLELADRTHDPTLDLQRSLDTRPPRNGRPTVGEMVPGPMIGGGGQPCGLGTIATRIDALVGAKELMEFVIYTGVQKHKDPSGHGFSFGCEISGREGS